MILCSISFRNAEQSSTKPQLHVATCSYKHSFHLLATTLNIDKEIKKFEQNTFMNYSQLHLHPC